MSLYLKIYRSFPKVRKEYRWISGLAIIFVSHRLEKGLETDMIFELTPSEEGSTWNIIFKNGKIDRESDVLSLQMAQ